MRSKSSKKIVVAGLAATSLALLPGSALATNREFNPPPAVHAAAVKNYSMNSATGDYNVSPQPASPAAGSLGDSIAPDVRDAAAATVSPAAGSLGDSIAPDVRDVATGARIPSVTITPAATVSSHQGFQWGDAGLGAGGLAVVALLALAAAFAVQHHRRQPGSRLAS